MTKFLDTKAAAYGAMILVGGALLYWVANKVIDKAAGAINPTSDKNLAYQGANSVGAALTGDKSFSLGSWLYDITHPGESAEIRGTPPYAPRKLGVRKESIVYDYLANNG